MQAREAARGGHGHAPPPAPPDSPRNSPVFRQTAAMQQALAAILLGVLTLSSAPATTLTVDGNATIWTPSITGILEDGVEHVIDTLSQPDPAALAGLTRLRLPLLGMVDDSVAYTGTNQAVY